MFAVCAPLFGFSAGASLAWLERSSLIHSPQVASVPAFQAACGFGFALVAPASVYFLGYATDWSFAYFVSEERLPRFTVVLLVMLCTLSVPFGFFAGAPWARAHQASKLGALAMSPALAGIAAILATLPRISVEASYRQYHENFGTQPLADGRLGLALLWAGAVMLTAVAGLYYLLSTSRH